MGVVRGCARFLEVLQGTAEAIRLVGWRVRRLGWPVRSGASGSGARYQVVPRNCKVFLFWVHGGCLISFACDLPS